MDSTAIAKYTPQKKRVFTGSSSSPCMDPDVIEIAPPSADEISKFKSKSKTKRKQISSYEIIDVDMDEDCSDVVFIDARVECNSKRKRSMGISLGPSSASQSNSKAMVNSASTVQPNGVDPPSRRRSTNKGVTITSNVKTVVAQNMNPSYNNGSSIVGSSSRMARPDNDDVLITYECFNKFDTVVDYSDHFYSKENSAMKQPPKKWAKRIQKEWRILENDLPDTIFVRVYESRMDILRAAIIGAEGTPYHDGLFFFDVYFPSDYPNSPPLVKYCSGGLHINPNLYDDGYVCLSLLSTWDGSQQSWIPGTSTMLQNFEELVVGHFRNRVGDILMACKAYMEGVQVGCFVRGGVQHVDEGDNRSCSTFFKNDISSYIKTLISAFKKIGAKTSSRKEISRKANAIGF
ncbi:putative ubiquitin-conjugating enzyme E2 38 isoform X3 [Rutidosis leptorrhynchoides]|uniref:putative ubiquitin-conjugating enzyme E2 38 isoform X3 n=1 Tax=Rutidosis leptorrhynchoides TaxID=125765 RepID=UPI003A99987F